MIDVEMVEILFFNIILQIRVIFDRIFMGITRKKHFRRQLYVQILILRDF